MSNCTPHNPEVLAGLEEMSDEALVAYAHLHVSLDSCDLINALTGRIGQLKKEIADWEEINEW